MTGDTDGTESNPTRRSVLKAGALLAGGSVLGIGAAENAAAANGAVDPTFFNWRALEAAQVWDRGYRGRPDRTVALTDSGVEARHPDIGPWNGVRAVTRDGDLVLTTDDPVPRKRLDATESFSGTIGPGTFAAPDTVRHEWTAPKHADEVTAALSWSVSDVNDLEFYVESASGERLAAAATADMPETITLDVNAGETYAFVVETYASLVTDYAIDAEFFKYRGTLTTYQHSPFKGIDGENVRPDTPKVVGWYDEGSRYGRYAKPRDPDGHGSHCSSIMAGSGRASAVDPARVQTDEPQTTLALGEALSYEVPARADTGVYAAAYGEAIEVRIEGPDGRTLAESTIGTTDSSLWDNNLTDAPTVHDAGEATYTVHVTSYDGELVTAATVDSVQVGAFLREGESTGDRIGGQNAVHTGVAPNQSILGLQGLSGPTVDLADHADRFVEAFNVRAVNMSWGYTGGAPLGAAGGLLTNLPGKLRDIAEAGMLVCAAAGNAATPANGNGAPNVADESISVVATGPLDGISAYSSGGLAAYDEDTQTAYRKPDVSAPGGTLTDPIRAAKSGDPDAPESDQDVRDYQNMAGTSMATPFTTGAAGLVAQAMEEDAPASIALPAPADAGLDDVYRLKQVLLATATETAFTAAPYHRAHVPTYDFGARDPYEGFGRLNAGAAIDAVTRNVEGTTDGVVGLNLPADERAVAGHVQAGPGTVDVSVAFSHYSGANAGAAESTPHVDLFVYDAEDPAANGDPNVLARAQGLQGDASLSVSLPRDSPEKTLYVVAKLVNVPGVVNGYDVQAHLDLSVDVTEGFFASGSRTDDGSVFTAGQTDQVSVTVNPSVDSEVRDVVPAEWTVLADYSDDVARVERAGDVQYVYFHADAAADADTTVTYFAEAPSGYGDSGEYVFGAAQVKPSEERGWVDVAGTTDTNVVLGQST